jgi:hypothetical protein
MRRLQYRLPVTAAMHSHGARSFRQNDWAVIMEFLNKKKKITYITCDCFIMRFSNVFE